MTLLLNQIPSKINIVPKRQDLSNGFIRMYWESEQRFDQESEDILYATILKLASEVFGDDMSPYWNHKRSVDFLNTVSRVSIIFNATGVPIGWSGVFLKTINNQKCLYLDATGITRNHQKKSLLLKMMTKDIFDFWKKVKFRRFYLLMRSESSLIFDIVRKRAGNKKTYPLLTGEPVPRNIQLLAKEMAKILNQAEKIDLKTLVIKNAFNGPCPWRWDKDLNPLLSDGLMNSRNQDIHNFISQKLRPEDSMVIVAKVSILGIFKCHLGTFLKKSLS